MSPSLALALTDGDNIIPCAMGEFKMINIYHLKGRTVAAQSRSYNCLGGHVLVFVYFVNL